MVECDCDAEAINGSAFLDMSENDVLEISSENDFPRFTWDDEIWKKALFA